MAYKQYTKCVEPNDFTDLSTQSWVGWVLIGAGVAQLLAIVTLAVIAALSPLTSKPAILLAFLLVMQIIAYLTWWLEGRLICLNEADKFCAIIGRVEERGLAGTFKGGDNDYTMNIELAPGQEHLLEVNPKITGIGRGYDDRDKYRKFLHSEFEGSGIYRLREYMYVIAALLALAFYLPWPLDFILSLLAILAALIGWQEQFQPPNQAADPGNPLDVNPNLGDLSPNDLVIVKGEWIYDSLHKGWHEIHPVRFCCRPLKRSDIPEPDDANLDWSDYQVPNPNTGQPMALDDPANVELLKQKWCGMIHDCEDAEDGGSRDDPQLNWSVHPVIDGCNPPIVIT